MAKNFTLAVLLLEAWLAVGCNRYFGMELKGRLVDQDARPVSGAPVRMQIVFAADRRRDRDIRVKSDADGYFHFTLPRPEQYTEVYIYPEKFQASRSLAFEPSGGNPNPFYSVEPYQSWQYNQDNPSGRSGTNLLVRGAVLQFRMSRNGGPQRMVYIRWPLLAADRERLESSLDVATGKWTSEPCPQCDLTVRLSHCIETIPKSGERYYGSPAIELIALNGAGVQTAPPSANLEKDKNLAPAEGYLDRLAYKNADCSLRGEREHPAWSDNRSSVVYFHARGRQIYGRLEIGAQQFEGGFEDEISWGSIRVIANPRGDKNLNAGDSEDQPWPLTLPVALPFNEAQHVDSRLVEIGSEYRPGAPMRVRAMGMPGAARGCTQVRLIAGNESYQYTDRPKPETVNPDGSFQVTSRYDGQEIERMYLQVRCQTGCEGDACRDEFIQGNKLKRATSIKR